MAVPTVEMKHSVTGTAELRELLEATVDVYTCYLGEAQASPE